MYSLCMYTYSVCLHIRLIYIYTHVAPGNTLPNLEEDSPRGAANSSKILCEDLLNATDLALVLIFRWATFLPFCHASLTARAPGGTAEQRFLYPA